MPADKVTRHCKRKLPNGEVCGRAFEVPAGQGGKAQHCADHRTRTNRKRDVANAKLMDPEYGADVEGRRVNAAAYDRVRWPRQLAVQLKVMRAWPTPSPEDIRMAGEAVGIRQITDLDWAYQQATDKYQDLIHDESSALGRAATEMAWQLLAQSDDPSLAGNQAASALGSTAKAAELFASSARPSDTAVVLHVPGLGTHCEDCGSVRRATAPTPVTGITDDGPGASTGPDDASRQRDNVAPTSTPPGPKSGGSTT